MKVVYFKLYKSPRAIIDRALETASYIAVEKPMMKCRKHFGCDDPSITRGRNRSAKVSAGFAITR